MTVRPDGASAPVRLTEWTDCGGCAAKWGATTLRELVADLDAGPVDDLLLGLAPFDDAAVHQLSDDVAVVATTDFFPPLVDDPADFGAIAAANACSDVFAVGGDVLLALNLAALPEALPHHAIAAIFTAAADTVAAAGGVVAGGHTIRSVEPIFGLAVIGTIHPDRILTKAGAQPDDVVMLSKPLGTGLVLAGGEPAPVGAAIAQMRALNRDAATAARALRPGVHALTDVTGFGLLGHALEIAEREPVELVLHGDHLPALPGALEAAARGVRTGGDARNRELITGRSELEADAEVVALAADPQTSGGLLACVDPGAADALMAAGYATIGEVAPGEGRIRLTR